MTVEDRQKLDALWETHKKIRSCILGQPWPIRKDLEYKKTLIENEMRSIVSRYTGANGND